MRAVVSIALLLLMQAANMQTATADSQIEEMLKLWDYNDPAATEQKFKERLTGQVTGELRVAILSQIARTHSLRRNFETAHELLDEGSGLLTDEMPHAATLVALERGRTYNSNNQKKEALAEFRQAFNLADTHHIDGLAVDAAHMIAIAETGERAERWNLIAMTIAETSQDPDAQRWLGSLYNNLGWTYFDSGDVSRALNLFEKGVAFRKAREQTRAWQIARWTVARAWRELGRIDEALEEQESLLLEAGDDEGQLGYIHEELGELYLLREDARHQAAFADAYRILVQDGWLVANEPERLARLRELGKVDD